MTVTNVGTVPVNVTPNLNMIVGGSVAGYWTGPVPGAPWTLDPGTSVTFAWQYDAFSNGAVVWEGGVTGMAGAEPVAAESRFTSLVVSPLQVTTWTNPPITRPDGVWDNDFTLFVKVKNIGPMWVNGVQCQVPVEVEGDPLISQVSQYNPPTNLSPGGEMTFEWNYNAENYGKVRLSVTVWGDDQMIGPNGGEWDAYQLSEDAYEYITPLMASLSASPATALVGDDIVLTLTLTNNGSNEIWNPAGSIEAVVGGSNVSFASGPSLVFGSNPIAAWSTLRYSWTWTAVANGPVVFSVSSEGYENPPWMLVNGNPSTATVNISPLRAKLHIRPNPSNIGAGIVRVVLEVSNAGSSNIDGVTGEVWTTGGDGAIVDTGKMNMGPVNLGAYGQTEFVWEVDELAYGRVSFSARASGDDQASPGAGPDYSAPDTAELLISPLRAALAVEPVLTWFGNPARVRVSLTVTNVGLASVAGVMGNLVKDDSGLCMNLFSASMGPVALDASGGANDHTTFYWEYDENCGAGWTGFTASASGVEQGGMQWVQSNASTGSNWVSPMHAALSVTPHRTPRGTTMVVSLTMTNIGAGSIQSITPYLSVSNGNWRVSHAGGPTLVQGADPLGSGNTIRYEWSYNADDNGPVEFVGYANAYDNLNMNWFDTNGARAGATITPLQAAMSVVASPAMIGGGTVEVRLTVTNSGSDTVNGVSGDIWVTGGTGVVAGGASNMGPVDLPPSGTTEFAWVVTPSANGVVYFAGDASGDDQGTAGPERGVRRRRGGARYASMRPG
jgi:hypothetical protein